MLKEALVAHESVGLSVKSDLISTMLLAFLTTSHLLFNLGAQASSGLHGCRFLIRVGGGLGYRLSECLFDICKGTSRWLSLDSFRLMVHFHFYFLAFFEFFIVLLITGMSF